MNRRSLLALLGGAVVSPSVGVKAAASALGMTDALALNGPKEVAHGIACSGPHSSSFWGSPLQIAFDAKEQARHHIGHGHAYPHMKSWGHGFRTMVVERDFYLQNLYRHKMQEDAGFREKVLSALLGSDA
jgi:hypothetical protein